MRIKAPVSGVFFMRCLIKLGNQNGGLSLYVCSVDQGEPGATAGCPGCHVSAPFLLQTSGSGGTGAACQEKGAEKDARLVLLF